MNIRKLTLALSAIGLTALIGGALLLQSVTVLAGNNDTEIKVDAKQTAPIEGISAIRVVTKAPADVNIYTVTGNKVQVALSGSVYSNADIKEPELKLESSGDTLNILVLQDKNWRKKVWFNVRFSSELKLAIGIPSAYPGSVSVQTASGDVSTRWSGSALSIKTASGDVVAHAFTGKLMEIRTASGDVRAAESKPSRLSVATASGDVELKDLSAENGRVRTASGDVTVAAIQGGELSFKSTSGDLSLTDATGISIEMASTSGEIGVQRMTAEHIKASTTSGDLRLKGLTGDLTVTSTSGSVKAELISFRQGITCSTTSGDIRIRLASKDPFSFTAHTHGDIRYTGPDRKKLEAERHLELPCDTCTRSIKLSSVSGDIEVN